MNEAQASEYVEQHEVMLVMAAGKEAVPAVATVTWKSSTTSEYIVAAARCRS